MLTKLCFLSGQKEGTSFIVVLSFLIKRQVLSDSGSYLQKIGLFFIVFLPQSAQKK